jgi:hypothetical protein
MNVSMHAAALALPLASAGAHPRLPAPLYRHFSAR